MKVWLNEQLVERKGASIDIEERGFQFGDGIYEVIKVYNGNMFTAMAHIERFYRCADELQIVIPYTKDVMLNRLHELVEENELKTGHIYMQISRGVAPRGHVFPEEMVEPTFVAYTVVAERPMTNIENGVKAIFAEDIRWLRCDIKSLNLLGSILVKQQAKEAGAYEAVQHRGEIVTEGGSSNVYGIKDGILYTHPVNNLILNGITRQVVLECCAEIGLTVVEEAMTKQQALTCEEFFLTATTSEITPIIQIDEYLIGEGVPGQWTKKLQAAYDKRVQQTATLV